MAKNRRVMVEGQDLPCLLTDAASTSQMDLQVVPVPDPWELVRADRPTSVTRRIGEAKEKDIRSTSRSDERREEAHRPSRSPIRTSRSQYGQQPGKSSRKSRPYSPVRAPHQDKGKGPVTSRVNKDASHQSTSRAGKSHSNREESRSTASRRSRDSPVKHHWLKTWLGSQLPMRRCWWNPLQRRFDSQAGTKIVLCQDVVP